MNRIQRRSRQDDIGRKTDPWHPWVLLSPEMAVFRRDHDQVMDSIYRSLGVPPALLSEFADAVAPPTPPRSGQDRTP